MAVGGNGSEQSDKNNFTLNHNYYGTLIYAENGFATFCCIIKILDSQLQVNCKLATGVIAVKNACISVVSIKTECQLKINMIRIALLFYIASSLICMAVFAADPSFDCSKTQHEIELLICDDDELAALDRSLAELYSTLRKNLAATDVKQLQAEQRGWIKGRNECWKSDNQHGCVKRDYEARIDELKDR